MLSGVNKFAHFLNGFTSKGDKSSNTAIPFKGGKGGSYNIPKGKYDKFLTEYSNELKKIEKGISREPISLTELFPSDEPSPIVVDLDIKYKGNVANTKITQQTMRNLYKTFTDQLFKHFPTGDKNINTTAVFTTRDKPYYDKSKDLTSDGIHIEFPFIHTDGRYTTILRNRLYKSVYSFIEQTGSVNSPENTYDDRIAKKRGPWSLYGANKGDAPPYTINCVYSLKDNEIQNITKKFKEKYSSPEQIVKLMSIRVPRTHTDFINTELQAELCAEFGRYITEKRKIKIEREQKIFIEEVGMEKICGVYEYELHEIRELLDCFSIARSEDYDKWINIGMFLYIYSPELLPIWQEFSSKCPVKYDPDVCEKKWAGFKENNLLKHFTKAKLRSFARIDNKTKYDEIRMHHVYDMLYTLARNYNPHDMALILYQMYGKKMKITIPSQGKQATWWIFRGHIWHNEDPRCHILKYMSTVLVSECENILLSLDHNSVYIGDSTDDIRKGICRIINKLKSPTTKQAIIKECEILFLDKDFIDKIDNDPYLFPMKNGIYDFHTFTFRNGTPEDYCTISSPTVYDPKAKSEELITFFKQIAPYEQMYHFLLERLSLGLIGIFVRYYVLAYGKGKNGKSKCINNLMQTLLGYDYFSTQDPAILTGPRKGAGAPTPEITELKHKRVFVLEETEQNDRINSGMFKWLNSGADLSGRDLFATKNTKFKACFKTFLLFNNYPLVDDQTAGFWERVLVLVFPSTFCDHPDPDPTKLQFKQDHDIDRHFQDWASPLFNLLVPYTQNYLLRKQVAYIPSIIRANTQKYKDMSNYVHSFARENLIKTNNDSDFVSVQEIYTRFSEWYRFNKSKIIPNSQHVRNMLESCVFNKDASFNRNKKCAGWYSYILKDLNTSSDPSEPSEKPLNTDGGAGSQEINDIFDESLQSLGPNKRTQSDLDDYFKFNNSIPQVNRASLSAPITQPSASTATISSSSLSSATLSSASISSTTSLSRITDDSEADDEIEIPDDISKYEFELSDKTNATANANEFDDVHGKEKVISDKADEVGEDESVTGESVTGEGGDEDESVAGEADDDE